MIPTLDFVRVCVIILMTTGVFQLIIQIRRGRKNWDNYIGILFMLAVVILNIQQVFFK